MYNRVELVEMEEEISTQKIDIEEFTKELDRLLSVSTSLRFSFSHKQTIDRMMDMEEKFLELIENLISYTNPDMNEIIELDDTKKERYRLLSQSITWIKIDMEEQRQKTVDDMLLSLQQKNNLENQVKIRTYQNYIKNLLYVLIYLPLKHALKQFNLQSDTIIVEYMRDGERLEKAFEKNENLFWFYVYSYLINSSQRMSTMAVKNKTQMIGTNTEINSIGHAIARTLRAYQGRPPEQQRYIQRRDGTDEQTISPEIEENIGSYFNEDFEEEK